MQQIQASAADIWRAAPSPVRQPPGNNNNSANQPDTLTTWPTMPTTAAKKGRPKNNSDTAAHDKHDPQQKAQTHNTRRPSLDTTECTTQSPLTRTTQHQHSYMSRFDEMEAAILRNHEDSITTSTRVNQMDDRITRTMAACERVSSQVTNLESQMCRVFEKLDQIVNRLPPPPPQRQLTDSQHRRRRQHLSKDTEHFIPI
jgi:chromosome segregation ATPase